MCIKWFLQCWQPKKLFTQPYNSFLSFSKSYLNIFQRLQCVDLIVFDCVNISVYCKGMESRPKTTSVSTEHWIASSTMLPSGVHRERIRINSLKNKNFKDSSQLPRHSRTGVCNRRRKRFFAIVSSPNIREDGWKRVGLVHCSSESEQFRINYVENDLL